MRTILLILSILFTSSSFSQTVEDLEYELSYFKSNETWGNKTDIARKLLKIDRLNNKAIDYLIEVYGRNDQSDSITLLFNSLLKSHPNSPEPFIFFARERNAHFAGLSFTERINYLKKAIEIDNKNIEAIYSLGKIYYELFNKEYIGKKKKANLYYYAKNATNYFSTLNTIDEKSIERIKYPLIQLANYLEDEKRVAELEKVKIQSSYFPIIAFSGLPKNWKTDYSINVITHLSNSSLSGIESAIFLINWYSRHLKALNEPVLNTSPPTKTFRFTYLRTFDNPIVIRLVNNNSKVSINWKVSDGAGGYEPGKIITNKSKELKIEDWKRIENKINSIKFWELQTVQNEILGTDGSQWILEGKKASGKYHVVDRWCGAQIYPVCNELIELTDLILKEDDIY